VVIVAGSVRYLERVALPRGAVLTVAVEDLSRAGAPDGILAKTAVPVDGQVPIAFSLTIDAADVDDRATLSVRARLRSSVGTWITDAQNEVVTQGAGETVDVVVRRMRGS
jgi:putative lipoprotein